MRNNTLGILFIAVVAVGSAWATIYNFYMAWFRPSEFLEKSAGRVKDWWPFAEYFRSYYSSFQWLWMMRLGTTIFMLAIVYMAYRIVIGQFSIFP